MVQFVLILTMLASVGTRQLAYILIPGSKIRHHMCMGPVRCVSEIFVVTFCVSVVINTRQGFQQGQVNECKIAAKKDSMCMYPAVIS